MKKKLLSYTIAIVAGLAVTFAIAALIGLFESDSASEVFKKLSDAALVTGVVIFGIGLLTFCSNKGAFDMVWWGLKGAARMLIPGGALKEEKKTYAQYREERAAKPRSFKFLLIVGAVFLALAVLFVILYYAFPPR